MLLIAWISKRWPHGCNQRGCDGVLFDRGKDDSTRRGLLFALINHKRGNLFEEGVQLLCVFF